MGVAFDNDAADSLVRVAGSASAMLRDQGFGRRRAAEDAVNDFRGPFARLFELACSVEFEDRIRLAVALEDLATDVVEAKTLALRERDRQHAVKAWQAREGRRVRDRAADPTGAIHAESAHTDPEPNEPVVAAPTISAVFAPRERRRLADSSANGKTSADPAALREFVSHSRAANLAQESQLTATRNAWVAFAAGCAWVRVGTVSFSDRVVQERRRQTA